MIRVATGIFVALELVIASNAFAQTAEQRNNCAGDVRKFCTGVNPANGGIPKCLAANKDKLSEPCRKALKI